MRPLVKIVVLSRLSQRARGHLIQFVTAYAARVVALGVVMIPMALKLPSFNVSTLTYAHVSQRLMSREHITVRSFETLSLKCSSRAPQFRYPNKRRLGKCTPYPRDGINVVLVNEVSTTTTREDGSPPPLSPLPLTTSHISVLRGHAPQ